MLKKLIIPSLIVALAGCDLGIPNLNNPSVDSLEEHPTPASVNAAALGLVVGNRLDYADTVGYLVQTGTLGREVFALGAAQADPRYFTELLLGELSPDGPFGGGFWYRQYNNIRNANTLLAATNVVQGMTDEQLEGVRGFAKTIKAMDFYTIIVTHGDSGAPIDVSRSLEQELAPFASESEVYAHAMLLLDEAATHLAAGGDAFSFNLPSGFAGFNTPGTFATFSQGIAARVALQSGDADAALAALENSFISADSMDPQLNLGVYHNYGTGTGETPNSLSSMGIYAHPSLRDDAEGGDARVTAKLAATDPFALMGVDGAASDDVFTFYTDATSSVPILRNEELILIRAEANWANDDLVTALQDINFIRIESGGLLNSTAVTSEEVKDEILRQRRYSLMFEGDQWVSARRLGELESLPNIPGGVYHAQYPVPLAEQLARQ